MSQNEFKLDSSPMTDLALEANNIMIERTGGEISGIILDEVEEGPTTITRVKVENDQAGAKINKKPGDYITIESELFRSAEKNKHDQLSGIIAKELEGVIGQLKKREQIQAGTTLVIGLGNWNATPDALGPQVLHHLLVTRHLYDQAGTDAQAGMSSIAAISPGVLGLTGIETAEIIRGVVDRIKPSLIIAVDALAARDSNKLASTVQISNTGIYPGSGVGKKRIGITQEDIGVPVVAMGMPTVINSVNLVNDTVNTLMERMEQKNLLQRAKQFSNNEYQNLLQNILAPFLGDLIVTPKGIDKLIRDTSRIIAGGINIALHPDINEEDVSLYLQ